MKGMRSCPWLRRMFCGLIILLLVSFQHNTLSKVPPGATYYAIIQSPWTASVSIEYGSSSLTSQEEWEEDIVHNFHHSYDWVVSTKTIEMMRKMSGSTCIWRYLQLRGANKATLATGEIYSRTNDWTSLLYVRLS